MTNAFSASSNLILPADPNFDPKKNPEIYSDLLSVHNAIRLLQQYLDVYTGAIQVATASEEIHIGAPVNFFGSGGNLLVRNADATTGAKPCFAFSLNNYLSGAVGQFRTCGIHNLISGLTTGTIYYLATIPGLITNIPAAAVGNLVQEIGVALSPTSLLFNPAPYTKQL